MRGVRLALVLGLALLAIAVGLSLTRSPMTVAAANGVSSVTQTAIASTGQSGSYCQSRETLPQGTSSVRISLVASIGPRVKVVVTSGGQIVTSGEQGPGWTGEVVAVPVEPLRRTVSHATVCISFRLRDGTLYLLGATSPEAIGAREGTRALAGRMRIEYLRTATHSWASQIPAVIRHMGFGRAISGSWIAFLALALIAAVAIVASKLVLSDLGVSSHPRAPPDRERGKTRRLVIVVRRVPRTALICALVACLNAACWSIVTYAFQAPDEPDHFAYVEQLAEVGRLPVVGDERRPAQETAALTALHFNDIREQLQNHTIASQAEQNELQHELKLADGIKETGTFGAGVASSEPPLYYVVEAIPYELARGGSVLARLQLMRLTSALMAGLTAMFAFMFIREALPGAPPWTWTVGGLTVALVPLLGFMSGAVNPDALLFAVTAATFYRLAHAFRRGLSTGRAVTIGALMAIGFMTKLNFIGIAPGVLLGLIVLSIRASRVVGRSAYRMLALALALAFSPCVLYVGINALSHHPLFGLVSAAIGTVHGSALSELSYIWQIYLPHLPGTVNDFPGLEMARQVWFRGYVGLYGWFDTTFPGWVYGVALIPAGAIALLCGRALLQSRARLRGRLGELAVYASIAIGLMALVGADSFHEFPRFDAAYAQVRYLLPLLPLLGAALALAARGAGRRWGPIAGTLIVVLFLAHDVFSQLLVVARYYG
jgi:hypothetical protein